MGQKISTLPVPRIRLKDVANSLGLDRSTVSHALANTGTVRKATRRVVLDKAVELGYVRNRLAAGMVKRGRPVMGLVLPHSLFGYGELQQHAQWEMERRGGELHVALTGFDEAREEEAMRTLLESQVAGLLIKSTHVAWSELAPESALKRAHRQGIPVVTFDEKDAAWGFPTLVTDYTAGFLMLAKHARGAGFERMVYFPDVAPPTPGEWRLEGLEKAWRKAGGAGGVPCLAPMLEGRVGAAARKAYQRSIHALVGDAAAHIDARVKRELTRARKFGGRTLVVCATEFLAMRCLAVMRHGMTSRNSPLRGAHIARPALGVAALTRSEGLALLTPGVLTALYTPLDALARAGVEMFFSAQQGKEVARRVLAPRLAIGASTQTSQTRGML